MDYFGFSAKIKLNKTEFISIFNLRGGVEKTGV
jgi:hypothetical protein